MRPSRGVLYMLLATFSFGIMAVFVRLVAVIPSVEVVFFRSVVSLVLSYLILRSQGVSIWGHNRKLLVLRGFVGAVALIAYFTTLQKVPLATAVTLQMLFPVFTAIWGIFIVRERVHPLQWLFFAISFAGILVVKGFDARIDNFYLFLGIFSAIFGGLAYNIIRKLKTSEHPLVIVMYFPLITIPLAGTWSATVWVMPQGWEWLYLVLVGVFTQIAQYFMTKSYQLEDLSKVSPLQYLQIIYGIGFGYLFFQETYAPIVYLGIGLVLLGVVLNLIFKNRLDRRAAAEAPNPT